MKKPTLARLVAGGLGLAIGLALGYGASDIPKHTHVLDFPGPPTQEAWRELPGTVDSIHDYVDEIYILIRDQTDG